MSRETSMLSRTTYVIEPSEFEVRTGILNHTLEVLSCTPLDTLQTVPAAQFFAVASLRLNDRLLVYFDTADAELSALFDNRPANGVERRRIRIEDLSPRCLLILGLTGIIEASMGSGCADDIESGSMSVVFEHLDQLSISWGESQCFAPLESADIFDLRSYVVETVFSYHDQESSSNAPASSSEYAALLWSMLHSRWDNGSIIQDRLFTILSGSSNNEIRDAAAGFLNHNSNFASRHPRVYDILYEMLRMSRHEPLSYFDHENSIYLETLITAFRTTETITGNNSDGMECAVNALLERVVNNDLLGTLMLCAYASEKYWLEDSYWQGIRCGPTTRFWGERVIALARRSNDQQAVSNGPDCSTLTDRIREFCHAPSEFIDDTKDSNEGGESDVEPTDERALREWEFVKGRLRYLPELKKVLLRDIGE